MESLVLTFAIYFRVEEGAFVLSCKLLLTDLSNYSCKEQQSNKALFRCEIFLDFATVALSFVCDKYCLIID